MTLIITSIAPAEIVMTADSRATLMTNEKVTGADDHCRKIFPIADHPVVIAHHGENDLGEQTIPRFLDGFTSRLNTGNLSILEIADAFDEYARKAVRKRLRSIAPEKHGVGFLFAGYGADDRGPAVVELFWKIHDDALVTEERQWFASSVVSSGDGAAQAERTDWRRISDASLAAIRAYNERLLGEAIDAKVDPNTVGGHLQEIVIRRGGWEWTMPPPLEQPVTRPTTRSETKET